MNSYTINSYLLYLIYILATTFLVSDICYSQFLPSEIAIIVNSNSLESKEIGNLYADIRNIPKSNIISIATKTDFSIDRDQFERELVAPIKQKLISNENLKNIKIIITTLGIPLKINEIPKLIQENEIRQTLTDESNQLTHETQKYILEINTIEKRFNSGNSFFNLKQGFDINKAPDEAFNLYNRVVVQELGHESSNTKPSIVLKNAIITLFGLSHKISENNNKTKNRQIELADLHKQLIIEQTELSKISSANIKKIINANRKIFGTINTLGNLKTFADRIIGSETSASVDSELSLIWLLPTSIPIGNRLPNPFFLGANLNINSPSFPIILTSRLDGPNVEIIKKNLLTGIEIENKGSLAGNFLIDSRGMGFDQRTELADWDRKLVSLAKRKFGENIKIEFDSSPELASETQDIAFYLGWYRLRNYENAYKFKAGAIGFHIASEEAINIHDPSEKGWCKNLLERGVVATVGAVEEPYLDSFPHPEYFFPLLSTGKYNLIEAYYFSTKYLSWKQVLFGDPLYNPFKNKVGAIQIEELDFKAPQPLFNKLNRSL